MNDFNPARDGRELFDLETPDLSDILPVGVFRTDAAGLCTYVNQKWCEMTGFRADESFDLGWMEGIHPEDRERVAARWRRAVAASAPIAVEFRFQRRDGKTIWVLGQAVPIRGDDGSAGFAGTTTDITERKDAEETLQRTLVALQRSEERFANAFRHAPIGIALVGLDGRPLQVNRALCDMLGYSEEELLKLSVQAVTHPDDMADGFGQMRRILAGEVDTYQLEKRYAHKDGHVVWGLLNVSMVRDAAGAPLYVVTQVRDITEQKRTEDALRQAQFALDNAGDGVFWTGREGRFQYVNRAACSALGYSREELLSMSLADIDPPYTPEVWREQWEVAKARQGEPIVAESVHYARDGRRIPIEITANFMSFRGNECICAFVRDITERQRVAAALRENEAKFRALAETVSVATFIFQGEKMPYVNPAAEVITGYGRDELFEMNFWDVIHPEFRDLVRERGLARQRGEAVPPNYEVKIRRKSGEERWVEFTAAMIEYEGQHAVLGTAFDVTERKYLEDRLRDSERRFRAMIENSSDMLVLMDTEGRITYLSPSIERILGYGIEEQLPFVPVHPEDRDPLLEVFFGLVQRPGGSVTAQYRVRHRDGSWRWLESIATNLMDDPIVHSVIVNSRDITDRKEAVDALRRSEERFALATRGANDGLWDWNVDTGEVYFSSRWKEILGYADDEMTSHVDEWRIRIHPDDWEHAAENLFRHLKGQTPLYQDEHRLLHRDGTYRWILARGVCVRRSDGMAHRMAGSIRDISVRKRNEERLRQSEERYALAVAGARDVLWDWDVTAGQIYLSPRWKEMLGFAEDEIGDDFAAWGQRVHRDDIPHLARAMQAHLEGRTSRFAHEHRVMDKDGDYRWILVRGLCVRHANGSPHRFAGSLTDITDRKRAEEQEREHQAELAHVLRTKTMGEMAAGLAHELNQPLSAIVNYARGCERRMDAGGVGAESLREAVEEISAEALRAGEIIRRLRAFVRKEEPRRSRVDLNDLARDVARLVAQECQDRGIDVRLALSSDPLPVTVDAIQIEQVILNLVRNGIEAVEAAGNGRRDIRVQTVIHGDSAAEVRVSDSGSGVTKVAMDRLFEPFFTTKRDGLGMGLAISRSIIEAHRGRLWAVPNSGRGMTFLFTLPLLVGGYSE